MKAATSRLLSHVSKVIEWEISAVEEDIQLLTNIHLGNEPNNEIQEISISDSLDSMKSRLAALKKVSEELKAHGTN